MRSQKTNSIPHTNQAWFMVYAQSAQKGGEWESITYSTDQENEASNFGHNVSLTSSGTASNANRLYSRVLPA